MNEPNHVQKRVGKYQKFGVGLLLLAVIGLSGVMWWKFHEKERHRAEAHQGLEGTWIDDTGRDVSYQFRHDGAFLVREKTPGNLAPFTGDPGIDHHPQGKWRREGNKLFVETDPHWGFELTIEDDGFLRGEYFLDMWSGQGEHSRNTRPTILRRK